MPRPLLRHLEDVASQLAAAQGIFLCLDFDGTLAPIVVDAGAALLPPETRAILVSLASHAHVSVAVVSGRSLADLRERVGVKNFIYSGNHGLEIGGPSLHFLEPTSAERVARLEALARHLRERLARVPGAWVEDKRLSVSVHFREAPVATHPEIRKIVEEGVAPAADFFFASTGLRVFDVRPKVNWNKGMAVRWIRKEVGLESALPVYVGDDATDEDAFAAFPSGITVRVGRAVNTLARYDLERQSEVQTFLSWLAERAAADPPRVFCGNEA